MAFMSCKDILLSVAILKIVLEDMLAHFTLQEPAGGFKKMLALQLHGIKQSRSSTSE